MATERDILRQITEGSLEGLSGLLDRHGALFREGLVRFYGEAGPDRAPVLTRLMTGLIADLRADRFDDLHETFYDWVFRSVWTLLMEMRIEEAEGDHADPDVLFQLVDPHNEAALEADVRTKVRSHLEACELCRELLDRARDVPVDVRHAGAPCPDEFRGVVERALELIPAS